MNTRLIENCDLLAKNRRIIMNAFAWDSESMSLAGSAFYVGLNKEADPEKLRECQKILRKKAGLFSEYRGNVKMPVLCKMAVAEEPEAYFDGLHGIVDQMKKLKWIDSEYKVLAAMTIYDRAEPAEYSAAIDRMAELYQGMKKDHPWLTNGQDIPFAAMLAVSGLDTKTLGEEMETCYQILKERFYDRDAVQSLSHVLAVDKTDAAVKCGKVEKIFDLLKEEKHKYGTGDELAVLGTLCMLDLPAETIAAEIIEADEYLKTQKGFGNLLMGEKMRRMYAAVMVMDTHRPADSMSQASLLDGVLALVIAMEICMMVMMTSMCVSTSASH